MPHDRGHAGHSRIDPDAGDRRVALAVAVNLGLTVAQIVAGVLAGSLALIADAVHNLSDAVSLGVAWIARRIARRPADARMTFGYGRAELVAALVNYTTLVVIALWLGWEGVSRLVDPQEVAGWVVVWVAGIALVIDTATALLLAGMREGSANIRAAFLHNVADALGSVAVIVSGVLILLYDWRLVDPAVTLLISGYILWHAVHGIGPVIRILMQGAPPEPHAHEVLAAMQAGDDVEEVHHICGRWTRPRPRSKPCRRRRGSAAQRGPAPPEGDARRPLRHRPRHHRDGDPRHPLPRRLGDRPLSVSRPNGTMAHS